MSEITIHDRTFSIQEPDALIIARLLAVIGDFGTRAEEKAISLGRKLSLDSMGAAEIFTFLSALTPDDILKLMAALLQFEIESEGILWLRQNPPSLANIVMAVSTNLEYVGGITEAIRNFTATFSVIRQSAMKPAESL